MSLNNTAGSLSLSSTGIGLTPASQATHADKTPEKEKAKVWLNVGTVIDGVFVKLPMGIPLDTMKPNRPVRVTADSTPDAQAFADAQMLGNQLQQHLLNIAKSLKPGEKSQEMQFVVQVQVVNDEITEGTLSTEGSVISDKLAGLFSNQ
ncbi:hypothetical protein FF38_10509 [Lucilia cuprina]|uniref:Uncharacterized protein n=1 Tax=Lucilia cuprina TaxID=7375 RepID=A0A0L0CDL4_LUCCU|nr:hypothetical protein FF38_10509 [Lucilia cuprina]